MSEASILCERIADPDLRILRLRVTTSKGDFSGTVEIRNSMEAVRAAGAALKAFPSKVPDDCELYLEGSRQNLQLNMKTTDHAGHCSLQVALIDDDGEWWFRTTVEPLALGRLGDLFISLSEGSSDRFGWVSSTAGTLDDEG